jgi:hypothetical protein
MQERSYFVSEEAEKAARYDMMVALKRTQQHLATLRGQAKKIGEALANFGLVLANPSWRFEVQAEKIVGVSSPEAGRGTVTIPREYLNDGVVVSLIADIQRASEDLKSQSEAVGDIVP